MICSFLTVIVIFTIMLMTTAFRIQVIHMKPFEISWQMTLMSLWTGFNNILWRQIPKNNPIWFYSHRIIAKVSWGFFLYPTLNDYHLILSHIILSYRTLPYLQLCLSYLTLSYLHSYYMCGSYKVCNFYNFVFFFSVCHAPRGDEQHGPRQLFWADGTRREGNGGNGRPVGLVVSTSPQVRIWEKGSLFEDFLYQVYARVTII